MRIFNGKMVSRLYEHKPRVVDAICVGIHPMLECGLPSTITTRQDFSLFLTLTLLWQGKERKYQCVADRNSTKTCKTIKVLLVPAKQTNRTRMSSCRERTIENLCE
jgi:hypothetical protein